MPATLCHFRVVALADRPGAWRIHDPGASAGNEPPVVTGIMPRVHLGRIHRHQLLEIFQRHPGFIGIDPNIILGINHDDAISAEECTDPIHGVVGLAHRQADRSTYPSSRYRAWLGPILIHLSRKWDSFVIGRKTSKKRMVRRLQMVKVEPPARSRPP